ncbi:hypothetical protein AKJ64_02545 [candidate division MSBL1 archaeon SCGC-AAA259E17]|uniref:Uncharacterized protein n=1 Tax=candidate division MSBL1 archaeon SCGC-AAA259E17 TaxID=1698263 RepID=A0A133UES8_9EURY|nr:hypothetical protein AKJ64_02545 [candidate division MSBL1 archaeon SCGC-AAA259E17]
MEEFQLRQYILFPKNGNQVLQVKINGLPFSSSSEDGIKDQTFWDRKKRFRIENGRRKGTVAWTVFPSWGTGERAGFSRGGKLEMWA